MTNPADVFALPEKMRVLVTAGASGIGRATADLLIARGAEVHICDVSDEFLTDYRASHPKAGVTKADVSSEEDVARLFDDIKASLGGLDALINNAAISPKGAAGTRLGLFETELEDWATVFQVNFFAPIMLARGLADELARTHGSVVNVTSIAGSRVHPFAGAAYSTSKAALAALTREMAADFGPLGIRVNAIAPGEIDTTILSPGTSEIVAHQIPMHRLGTPDEVAKIIYVLCTDTSSYVNGAEVHINGGQHV